MAVAMEVSQKMEQQVDKIASVPRKIIEEARAKKFTGSVEIKQVLNFNAGGLTTVENAVPILSFVERAN